MPGPIIRVESLVAGYGGPPLLDGVSFEVRTGEIFAVLGGSGDGKSTLLRHLIGLQAPLAGRILIEDEDLAGADEATRRRILRKIGVMFQMGALFGDRSVLENVRLPLEVHSTLSRPAMDLVALTRLALVGMARHAGDLPAALSGGMRKRAAIARALALDPHILFLDEPSAGLDPVTSASLDALVLELSRSFGVTVVMVTHELPSILAVADRVIMLDRHTRGIIAEGDPRQLRAHSPHPRVRQFFNREPSTSAD